MEAEEAAAKSSKLRKRLAILVGLLSIVGAVHLGYVVNEVREIRELYLQFGRLISVLKGRVGGLLRGDLGV